MAYTVCVFCGSRPGKNPNWASAAQDLGCQIAGLGWRLVFGGGGRGLMGEVARGALSCQGKVVGIIPGFLTEAEPVLEGLHDLHVVENMVERKEMMIELSDAFVVLPGGIGTFEELFEVWTGNHIKAYTKPIVLVNLEGFYDGLLAFANEVRKEEFLIEQHFTHLKVVNSVTEAIALLQKQAH
jgi:uncharacterized protein (TIGR00730 family)